MMFLVLVKMAILALPHLTWYISPSAVSERKGEKEEKKEKKKKRDTRSWRRR